MSNEALTIVTQMDDLEAIRFLNYFGEKLFAGIEGEPVIENIPPELRELQDLKQLQHLNRENMQVKLAPQESARVARELLEYFASDEAISPALVKAWEEYDSDELFIGAILAFGFVTSMILFVATTEIEGEICGIKFRKHRASPKLVEAVTKGTLGAVNETLMNKL